MQSNSSFNKIVFWLLIIIVVVNVVVLGSLVLKRGAPGGASSYALAFTSEVHVFSGTVTGIGDNTLTVAFSPLTTSSKPGQKLSLEVKTDKATQVTQEIMSVPYYFKDTTQEPPAKAASFSHIRKGDSVRVNAKEDVRLIKNSSVTAQTITILPANFSINGTVEKVTGTTITVKGLKHAAITDPNAVNPETFTISTAANTEIVILPVVAPDAKTPAPKPQKVALSALKPGMQVNIYAEGAPGEIATNTAITALAIQAQQELPTAPVEEAPAQTKPTESVSLPVATLTP